MRVLRVLVGLAAALVLAGCGATGVEPTNPPTASTTSVVTVEGTFRPRLSWPDLNAESYVVGVVSDSGATWAWEGDATSVIVGDVPDVDWEGPGFGLEGPAALWFAAFDADGAELYSERTTLPAP